jgi:hypothetical protein
LIGIVRPLHPPTDAPRAEKTRDAAFRVPLPWRAEYLVPAANFLAFMTASAFAFLRGNDQMLSDYDGYFLRALSHELFRFADLGLGLPAALFEGMGTPAAMPNPLLVPSLIPIGLFGEKPGVALGYVVCAGLMFLSTYVLGRALAMRRAACLLAGWLTPLLFLPYHPWLQILWNYNHNPDFADTVSVTMLGLGILARGYAEPRIGWEPLGLALVVIWLFIACPLTIVILLPTAIPVTLGIMAGHFRQPRFLLKSGLFLLPSLAFLALGGASYLWGLYAYTAADFYPRQLGATGRYWDLVSMLFINIFPETPVHFAFRIVKPTAALLVGLAVAGLALAVWKAGRPLRMAALSVLVVIVIVAAYMTAYLITDGATIMPVPRYFEYPLRPLYALFASYAVVEIAGRVLALAPGWHALGRERLAFLRRSPLRLIVISSVMGVALGILLAAHPPFVRPIYWEAPPSDTALTELLSQKAGIAPGKPFKGYVVNTSGIEQKEGQVAYDHRVFNAFGNPHRVPYLWMHDVPTFEAYAEWLEPPLYAVASRLLSQPNQVQTRNIIYVTRPEVGLLQSLGVRFLITDAPLPPPASLLLALRAPDIAQYVFELPDPNYGNYSPTEVVVARDATEAATRLADPHFDFRKTVVLDRPLSGTLQPAERSAAVLTRGGWRIEAKSPSLSLLLIPLQYSHCLSLAEHQAKGGRVVAVEQANLLSTALIFRGEVDATLSLIVSPFFNPSCRVADVRAMRAFGLAQLPRSVVAP